MVCERRLDPPRHQQHHYCALKVSRLYREGSDDTAYLAWCYLNGTKSVPTTAMVNASAPCFAAPAPGRYQGRLFSNNRHTKVAASNTITVP